MYNQYFDLAQCNKQKPMKNEAAHIEAQPTSRALEVIRVSLWEASLVTFALDSEAQLKKGFLKVHRGKSSMIRVDSSVA